MRTPADARPGRWPSRARSVSPSPPVGVAARAGAPRAGGAAPAPPSAAAYAGPVGAGEGQLSVLAWPGYAEDGSTDPAVDWVTPVRAADRLPGHRQDLRHVRRGRAAVLHRRVRRGVRLRRRLAAARVRRPRPAGEHRLVPNYADIFPELKDKPWNTVAGTNYGVPHGRGANLLLYNTAAYPTAPDVVEGHVGPGVAGQGQDQPVRRRHLHRRRRRVPDGHPARAGDQEPVRAGPHPVRRRRRAGPPAEAAGRRVLGGRRQAGPGPGERRGHPVAGLAAHREPRERRVRHVGGHHQARPRARPAGPTPG